MKDLALSQKRRVSDPHRMGGSSDDGSSLGQNDSRVVAEEHHNNTGLSSCTLGCEASNISSSRLPKSWCKA